MLVAVDHPRREPLGEESPAAAVSRVVLAGVVALEPLHCSREGVGRAFEDRVIVRAHQAVRVDAQPEPADGAPEEEEEQKAVSIVAKEHRLRDRAGGDVEKA